MITVLSESLLMPDSDVQFVCLISVTDERYDICLFKTCTSLYYHR